MSPSSLLEGTQSLAASKWLKARGTTDAMITRAFQALGTQNTPAAPMLEGAGPKTGSAVGAGAGIVGGSPFQTNRDIFDSDTMNQWNQDHRKF